MFFTFVVSGFCQVPCRREGGKVRDRIATGCFEFLAIGKESDSQFVSGFQQVDFHNCILSYVVAVVKGFLAIAGNGENFNTVDSNNPIGNLSEIRPMVTLPAPLFCDCDGFEVLTGKCS